MADSLTVLRPQSADPIQRLMDRIASLERRIEELERGSVKIPTDDVNAATTIEEGRIVATDVGGVRKLVVMLNGTLRSVTLT